MPPETSVPTIGWRDVLEMGLPSLQQLQVGDVADGPMPEEVIRHIFTSCDALWLHPGEENLQAPHAELTSGKCSNGFVNVLKVLHYTNLCSVLGWELAEKIEVELGCAPSWVVGSDHAGATLSFVIGKYFGAQHDFTEKGPDKTQVWKRFEIQPNETVLQVEELITTAGTLAAVREGIRAGNPGVEVKFTPLVATLIHRSDVTEFEGAPIIYLLHLDIETWEPDECPLCKAGSQRLRPKHNWAELTAR